MVEDDEGQGYRKEGRGNEGRREEVREIVVEEGNN